MKTAQLTSIHFLADGFNMDLQTTYSAESETQSSTLVDDRRRSPRSAQEARAWVSTESGTKGVSHQVIVTDLSLHGVGFTCDAALATGAIHWIVIGSGGFRASSRVRVANCRERAEGSYDIGGEFF